MLKELAGYFSNLKAEPFKMKVIDFEKVAT
jgi:hypothetical protein